MQTWHHIAQTPDGYYVHRLDPLKIGARADALRRADPELSPDEAYTEAQGEYVEAIRAMLGFPPRARWFTRNGWASSLSTGDPHPSMLAAKRNADIDTLPELGDVPTFGAP